MKEVLCDKCGNVYDYYEPKGNSFVEGQACLYGKQGYPRKVQCEEFEPREEEAQHNGHGQ